MNIHIPWRVQRTAYLIYQGIRSGLSHLSRRKPSGLDVSFYSNYHQATTGATIAISCIANQLANQHNVDGFVTPYSGFSRQFSLNVRQKFKAKSLAGNIVFVDIEQESKELERLLFEEKKVILTCHALPFFLHAVPQEKLTRNLELASSVHFVSEAQRSEHLNTYPELNLKSKSFFIPNYTRQSFKQKRTGNIGVVGYLSRPDKNACEAISLASRSEANIIECWGSEEIYGIDKPSDHPKIKLNGWSDSVNEMYDSFDVLISTSKYETFGLVVAEALSAGIPCILADIPTFRSLYSDCEGVILLTGDREQDIKNINYLLKNAAELKKPIIQFWEQRFSSDFVQKLWFERILKISAE